MKHLAGEESEHSYYLKKQRLCIIRKVCAREEQHKEEKVSLWKSRDKLDSPVI